MRSRSNQARPAGRVARAVVSAVVLACAPARADEAADALKVRAAAQEFDAGRRAYTERDFASAAEHFENAFRDVPSVEALRLAIRSRQQAGEAARAATLSELALSRYPRDEGTVSLAQATLAEARPKTFRITVVCEPECGVVVDDRAVLDESSSRLVLYVDPGKHSVAATWKNERARAIQVEGKAGKGTETVFRAPSLDDEAADEIPPTVTVPGPAEAPGADSVEGQGTGLPPAVTYVGLGLTTALAGATIWSAIDTRNNPGRDVVRAQCIDQGESCALYQDGLSRQKRTNILLGTTLGVALVTSVVGVAYTNWGGEAPGAGSSAKASWQWGAGWQNGLQVGAAGRF